MFVIDKYKSKDGICPVDEFRQHLIASGKIKEVGQINHYIDLLEKYGYQLSSVVPDKYSKYLDDKIYELRPSKNRILYCYCASNGKYVLLHGFRKTTPKTPPKEIKQAKKEAEEYERMILNEK